MSDEAPEVYIQWKGTSVCLDFQCTCSAPEDAYEFHLDNDSPNGWFRCPRCNTCWELDHHPTVRAVDPPHDNVVVLEYSYEGM